MFFICGSGDAGVMLGRCLVMSGNYDYHGDAPAGDTQGFPGFPGVQRVLERGLGGNLRMYPPSGPPAGCLFRASPGW